MPQSVIVAKPVELSVLAQHHRLITLGPGLKGAKRPRRDAKRPKRDAKRGDVYMLVPRGSLPHKPSMHRTYYYDKGKDTKAASHL